MPELLRAGKVSMMPVMSDTPPRSMNDYYAKVAVRRQCAGNAPGYEELEVVVRIPQGLAKTLAGRQKPSILVPEILFRVRKIATETAILRKSAVLTVELGIITDATMNPTFPAEATFTDQDGVEGWVLPPGR